MFQSFSGRTTFIAAIVMMAAVSALAQSDQGSLRGTVRDQTKAVIPGATVVAANQRTGEQRNAVSDERGSYLITNLRPSEYSIEVTAPGFAAFKAPGIQVLVGQTHTVDAELRLEGMNQTLTVTGDGETSVDTTSARLG